MIVSGRRKVLSVQRCILLACLPVCRTISMDALPLDLIVIQHTVVFRLRRGLNVSMLRNNWISDDHEEKEGYLGSNRLRSR